MLSSLFALLVRISILEDKRYWEIDIMEESLKCWNLEWVIDVKLKHQVEPTVIKFDKFVAKIESVTITDKNN